MILGGLTKGPMLGVRVEDKKEKKETFINYTENSSLHGIAYAFESGVHSFSRLFWLITFLGFCILGIIMSSQLYRGWKSSPVLTTVEDPAYPVTNLEFPAIIICGQGATTNVMYGKLKEQLMKKLKKEIGEEISDEYSIDELVNELGVEKLSEHYPGIGSLHLDVMARMFITLSPLDYVTALILLRQHYQTYFCTASGEITDDIADLFDNNGCGEEDLYDEINEACYLFNEQLYDYFDAKDICASDYLMTSFYILSEEQLIQLATLIKTGLINIESGSPFWTRHWRTFISSSFKSNGKYLFNLAPSILKIEEEFEPFNCLTLTYDENQDIFVAKPTDCDEQHPTLCESTPITMINCSQSYQNMTEERKDNLIDLIINPKKSARTLAEIEDKNSVLEYQFRKLDLEVIYKDLMELLWYSQLPCFDTENYVENPGELSLLKECFWKSKSISCASIFTTIPTDRGMCCSFNMKKADEILISSPYVDAVTEFQAYDKSLSYDETDLEDNYLKRGEPKSKQGISKGLTLILDAHSDQLDFSSINEDFHGFIAMVNGKDIFPITDLNNIKILPGHENFVAISAYDVTGTEDFHHNLSPEERNCYYPNEKDLVLFQNYSKDACVMECQMEYVMQQMSEDPEVRARCSPWYLPKWPGLPICNPWAAQWFRNYLELVPDDTCEHCKPDCERTYYSTKLSQVPFRRCDNKNIGLSKLCHVTHLDSKPALFGEDLLLEYENTPDQHADYVVEYQGARRAYSKDVEAEILYKANLQPGKSTYNAFEKDIAKVHFYFEQSSVIQYVRQPSMSMETFLGQVGGLLGLCIGMSFLSLVELIYWLAYRIWWSPKQPSSEETDSK